MSFFKKRTFWIIVAAVIVLVIGGRVLVGGGGGSKYPTAAVKRMDVIQEVTVSGNVKSKEAVTLAFEKTGKIASIEAAVGQEVKSGDILMTLDNAAEQADLASAQAKLESLEAHYNDLKSGGSAEEIAYKQALLDKANADLAADYSAVPTLISDASNKADNAVHVQADTMISNGSGQSPQLIFATYNQQAAVDAQNGRYAAEGAVARLKSLSQTVSFAPGDAEAALATTRKNLLTVNDFIVKLNKALTAAANLSPASIAADQTALSTALTNLNTATGEITTQIQTIASQKTAVDAAQKDLDRTKIDVTPDALAGAAADVKGAAADVSASNASLAETYLTSPIGGIVTEIDPKVGEIVSANATVAAVMNDSFKVEAYIPEVDIAKVAIGDETAITLDAYGNDTVFPAHVVQIDPAETIVDGVPTYKTTFSFDAADGRIKSGMTANMTITTATKKNVLAVPERAVFSSNGQSFVRVVGPSGSLEKRPVETGLRGADGSLEITGGLSAGETVVSSTLGL